MTKPVCLYTKSHAAHRQKHALEWNPIGLPTALRNRTWHPYEKLFYPPTRELARNPIQKNFSHSTQGSRSPLKIKGPQSPLQPPIAYPSLMPSPPIWSSFSLWLIAASAMLLMMLPGSAIARCYDARSQYFPRSVTARRSLFFLSFPLDYIIDPRMA